MKRKTSDEYYDPFTNPIFFFVVELNIELSRIISNTTISEVEVSSTRYSQIDNEVSVCLDEITPVDQDVA